VEERFKGWKSDAKGGRAALFRAASELLTTTGFSPGAEKLRAYINFETGYKALRF
jgi:hypothetical protein